MTEPEYLPRSWWADADWARGGAQLVDDDLWRLGNVNHYPGRARAFGIMTLQNLRHNLRGWRNFHVINQGWSDIGYQTCIAITTAGPVVVDLRGIGRVPAAHASPSNRRANWYGGATLWVIGNTEEPHPAMVQAYRHFRQNVWLPRWPTATGVTHHRRVPAAQTLCAGDHIDALVRSGALTEPQEDDVSEADVLSGLKKAVHKAATRDDGYGQELGDDLKAVLAPMVAYQVREQLDRELPKSMVDGEYLGLAVARLRRGVERLEAGQLDPTALAAALAPLLPVGQAPTVAQLVEALITVLGSLDELADAPT